MLAELSPLIWSYAALACLLLALCWWDFYDMILPDGLNVAVLLLGLVVSLGQGPQAAAFAALAAIGGLAIAWLFRRIAWWIAGQEPMGLGDVKFFAAAGAWVGLSGLPSVALVGSCASLLFVAIFSLARERRINMNQPVPFGPGLCAGLMVTVLCGPMHTWTAAWL